MKRSDSGPFMLLAELSVSILFFAVAAAVCLTLFVKSDAMSRDSQAQTRATYAAETIAETFRAKGESGFAELDAAIVPIHELEAPAEVFDGNIEEVTDKAYVCYYDQNWARCDSAGASYAVCSILVPTGKTVNDQITAYNRAGDKIYIMLNSAYFDGKGDAS